MKLQSVHYRKLTAKGLTEKNRLKVLHRLIDERVFHLCDVLPAF